MLIDTHCHVADPEFDADRAEVLQRAAEAGVERLVSVGCDLPSSRRAIALAEGLPQVYATAGVHPHEVQKTTDEALRQLRSFCDHPKVVAYGEIGLDFHYDHSPRPVQHRRFTDQISIALELSLPLIIHTRNAWNETFKVLEEAGGLKLKGVFHCFTGGPAEAERALELGFFISFSGIVTFPRADSIQAAARMIPLNRILIETDSPYLAPQGLRGRRNEPAYLIHIANFLAELRGCSYNEFAQATSENATELFF